MPTSAMLGRALRSITFATAALPIGATPVLAADLLGLRGTTKGEPFTELLRDRDVLRDVPAAPPTSARTPTPTPDRVIVRTAPLGPPAPDIRETGQTSSILRIGPAPNTARPVADGRVDRPAPRPNSAGSLPGGDPEGGLVVVRQDVRELIDQVAQFYGFETVLSRQVRGDVENTTLPSDFNAFIERLSSDRDLVFYFRNRELNASTRDENVSRVIGLGQSNLTELRSAIEAAGIDADRFPLRFIEASNSVLVDGPPSFVALVEVIAESLVRTDRPEPEVTIIRGNTIERSRPGQSSGNPGLAPIEFGPSVLDQPADDGSAQGTNASGQQGAGNTAQ